MGVIHGADIVSQRVQYTDSENANELALMVAKPPA